MPGPPSKWLAVACLDGDPIIGDLTLVMLRSNMLSTAAEADRDYLINASSKSSWGAYANYIASAKILRLLIQLTRVKLALAVLTYFQTTYVQYSSYRSAKPVMPSCHHLSRHT